MTITMSEEQFEKLTEQARQRGLLVVCRHCGMPEDGCRVRDGVCVWCRIFDPRLNPALPEEEDDGEGGETFDAGEGEGEGEDAQA